GAEFRGRRGARHRAGNHRGEAGGVGKAVALTDPSMRLITFSLRGAGSPRIGVRVARQVLDLAAAAGVAGESAPPASIKELLAAGDSAMKQVRELSAEAHADSTGSSAALLEEREIRYLTTITDAD